MEDCCENPFPAMGFCRNCGLSNHQECACGNPTFFGPLCRCEDFPRTLAAWLADPRFSECDKQNWRGQFQGGSAPFVSAGAVLWDSAYLPDEVQAVMPFSGMLNLVGIYPDGRTG